MGAGVLATGALGSLLFGRARTRGAGPRAATADESVRALFGDVGAGRSLGAWSIEKVYGVHLGAIPVVLLAASGHHFQIDVLRRDADGPLGVGNTPSLSLFLANRGDGARPTDEDQGLGAMALADWLSSRERAGAQVPALLTMRERQARFPQGSYSVL
jgi:hypothetical protein